jgi:predicted GTPase
MDRTRVVIVGAAGRDFHNFNLVYRDRGEYEVVAFTATQIPNIEGRLSACACRRALSERHSDRRRGPSGP